jgi:Ras-related protein Rab-5C
LIILYTNYRKVDSDEAEKLANKEGLMFFEISAKTNENIKKAFYSSIAELPFFEQANIGNKQKLINELGKLY